MSRERRTRAHAPRRILAMASTARPSCSRTPRRPPSGGAGAGDDRAMDAKMRWDPSAISLAEPGNVREPSGAGTKAVHQLWTSPVGGFGLAPTAGDAGSTLRVAMAQASNVSAIRCIGRCIGGVMVSPFQRSTSRRCVLQFLVGSPLLPQIGRSALAQDVAAPSRPPDPLPWAPRDVGKLIGEPKE